MDTTKPTTKLNTVDAKNGVYVRGVVISNRANAFRRKDGSGMVVKVQHEIAIQPGVVIWERYFNPTIDHDVLLEGEIVTKFPVLAEFQTVTLRAERYKADGEKLVISQAVVIA